MLNSIIRSVVLLLSILLCSDVSKASISDTLHVESYVISIDSIDLTAHSIKGSCRVKIKSKQNNVSSLRLSLLNMNIDSITSNGQLAYTYNDTTINITSPVILQQNDTISVNVYYHGNPQVDASGWGGFYFSSNYAFNMGAGFAANPHNSGKVWFPCIDEFNDKSLYDFYITTAAGYKAFCNGMLESSTVNGNGTITWHWKMAQVIASYLAGISVSNYFTLERTSNGIPVTWACKTTDTVNVLNTFQHLDTILSSYITAYGPYPFDKVGYSLVPFNNGAMEHASCIHIGSPFVTGTLTYETLWAHELSHMWWGDKVTCETEGDMWLNEGFASFNEAYITEKVYGKSAYNNWIQSNHRKALQFSHVIDGNYLSFVNVPHDYTYGKTVYEKGPDVVHTLRNYMGDSAFFAGCRTYMNNHAYGNANSYDLRDDLATATSADMNRFFDDWIFTEGFPHFSIDSVIYMPGGLDHYFVYVRQRSKGNNHLYSMPVEINLRNQFTDTTFTVTIDSATQMFHFAIYFMADMITVDRNQKISDAITDYEKWLSATGSTIFTETNTTVNVLTPGVDSSLVRVEHNWVTPDGWKQSNPGIRLSDYHYWKVDGIIKPGFHATLKFSYNGSNSTSTGHIDNTLITTIEDSLVLLYRASVGDDWQIVPNTTLTTGASVFDKVGAITTDSLRKGEYVLGIHDQSVGVKALETAMYDMTISPNPSSDTFHIQFSAVPGKKAYIKIFSLDGKVVYSEKVNNTTSAEWNARKHPAGTYIVELIIDNKVVTQAKVIHSR